MPLQSLTRRGYGAEIAKGNEEGKYSVYQFKQDVSAKYGELSLSGWGAMEVVAYE